MKILQNAIPVLKISGYNDDLVIAVEKIDRMIDCAFKKLNLSTDMFNDLIDIYICIIKNRDKNHTPFKIHFKLLENNKEMYEKTYEWFDELIRIANNLRIHYRIKKKYSK